MKFRKIIRDRLNRDQVYASTKYWDELAETGYGTSGTLLYTNKHINAIFHDVESKIVHGWAGDVAGLRILDIGCGAGRYCREFASLGARVHGVDFSPKSIEVAKKLTSQNNVSYSVGSIYDLEAAEPYDLILCSRVLAVACKDARDVQTCLVKVHAALKPGGRAIFVEPTHRSFMRRILKLNFAEFLDTLRGAGFEVVDKKCAEFYPGRMLLAYVQLPQPTTQRLFNAGEWIARHLPATTDQKFVLVRRR